MADVAPEQSMDEILEKLQTEYTRTSKQEAEIPVDAPRSAEVHDLSQASSGRKGRSGNRVEPQPVATDNQDVQAADTNEDSAPLISATTAETATAALSQLGAIHRERHRASEFPMGNQARTLEDVAREAMRPMLQGWLEAKLPEIVERLVKAELSRAIGETV
jgi:cell pole-organizing protein PopZ